VNANGPPTPHSCDRASQWLAFGWGLAEASCFFIVPDVFTSRLVLGKPRQGFLACFASLAGALLGGSLLYALGGNSGTSASVLDQLDWLPGISPSLIAKARLGLETHGLAALFIGVIGGIPFKLYAIQASGLGIGYGAFVLTSAIACLGRFLLVTFLAHFVSSRMLPNLSVAAKLRIHTITWTVFYLIYFLRMGL
jgi:membrane protein DedA with SNARE-associated domain